MTSRSATALTLFLLLTATAASAQTSPTTTVGFADFFETLYRPATQAIQVNGGPLMLPGNYGGANVLDGLLAGQIVSLPTGSNAGGFSWSYDATLGTWSRTVDSFGPQTEERAQTVGRGKLNFGFSWQRFTFDQLDGHAISLESFGTLARTATPAVPLYLRERASLSRADVAISTTFLNVGVTSRFDLGVFLPVISADIEGSLDYTLRTATSDGPVLSQGTNATTARERRVGDPMFRGKYNFIRRPAFGLALAVDGRFKTDNQLGAGGMRLQLITSGKAAAANPHVNGGILLNKCNDQPRPSDAAPLTRLCDGVSGAFVAGGIDRAVTNKLTLATDLHVQHVLVRATRTTQTFQNSQTANVPLDQRLTESANTATLALTGKFNTWGNMLVTFTALVPVNNAGLTDRFTPIVGLDYAW